MENFENRIFDDIQNIIDNACNKDEISQETKKNSKFFLNNFSLLNIPKKKNIEDFF